MFHGVTIKVRLNLKILQIPKEVNTWRDVYAIHEKE